MSTCLCKDARETVTPKGTRNVFQRDSTPSTHIAHDSTLQHQSNILQDDCTANHTTVTIYQGEGTGPSQGPIFQFVASRKTYLQMYPTCYFPKPPPPTNNNQSFLVYILQACYVSHNDPFACTFAI